MERNIREKIEKLQNQILQIANAVNELQSRLEFLQRTLASAPNDVKPLSLDTSSFVYTSATSEGESPIQDALLQTLNIISNNPQWMTSEQVSKITGRSKNLESSYLHKLFEMNILRRKRIGRKVYYTLANLPRRM